MCAVDGWEEREYPRKRPAQVLFRKAYMKIIQRRRNGKMLLRNENNVQESLTTNLKISVKQPFSNKMDIVI